MAVREKDVGRSEGPAVIAGIRVATSPGAKASPRPTGLSLQENLENRLSRGKANDGGEFLIFWCVPDVPCLEQR